MIEKPLGLIDGPEDLISTGLVEFGSLDDMRRYVKRLLESYQKQSDALGDSAALLMRQSEATDKDRGKIKPFPDIWKKKGSILLDTDNPARGKVQIMLEIVDECKYKIEKTTEALQSLEELDIPRGSSILLHISGGIPEKVILEGQSTAKAEAPPI